MQQLYWTVRYAQEIAKVRHGALWKMMCVRGYYWSSFLTFFLTAPLSWHQLNKRALPRIECFGQLLEDLLIARVQ